MGETDASSIYSAQPIHRAAYIMYRRAVASPLCLQNRALPHSVHTQALSGKCRTGNNCALIPDYFSSSFRIIHTPLFTLSTSMQNVICFKGEAVHNCTVQKGNRVRVSHLPDAIKRQRFEVSILPSLFSARNAAFLCAITRSFERQFSIWHNFH
jgi:hypothetical protein